MKLKLKEVNWISKLLEYFLLRSMRSTFIH